MPTHQRFPRLEHPKVKGVKIAEFNGLTIYGTLNKPKTSQGRNRIWIQIRQSEPKKLRVTESLAYARSLDVQFEEA